MSSASSHDAPRGPRGARGYFAASAIAQVCALLRYVLLARLLGPEQLGLAAALILTGSLAIMPDLTGRVIRGNLLLSQGETFHGPHPANDHRSV